MCTKLNYKMETITKTKILTEYKLCIKSTIIVHKHRKVILFAWAQKSHKTIKKTIEVPKL